jgi:DNA-binding transcriptional MerR regulator
MKEEFTPTDIEVSGEKYVEFCNKANEVINKRRDELDKEMLEMMKITQEIQEWEDFDNKLPISEWYCSDTKEVEELRETVKSFISQKLKEQRSEIMINLLLNSGLSLEEIKLLLKDSKNETK